MKQDKEKIRIREKFYRQTPKGKAVKMWCNMIGRVKTSSTNNKNSCYIGVKILLTKEEFYEWVVPELKKWIETKLIEDASIDRIDSTKHYEVGNLQLLPVIDNSLKRDYNKNVNAPDGYAWCYKCKDYLITGKFYKSKHRPNGLAGICIEHEHLRKIARRESKLWKQTENKINELRK